MRPEALLLVLGLLSRHVCAQYQQMQYQGGQQGFQQGGSYQSGGGSQSRYQQSHVVVGPGPVMGGSGNFGGQFKEQRTINIQENIQGVQQGGGYGYGSASGYQQYGRYGQQGGYGQQMGGQQGTAGRSVFQTNPLVLDSGSALMGAEVDLRLISYTNGALSLPNGTTCKCPIANCNFVPSNQQNQCQFSFVIVISSADQSIQYSQSNFYPVPSNGVMATGNWTNQYTFYMTTKPVAIDVFVQHLGVVIDSTSGQLLFFNHLALVDSFVVDITKFNADNTAQGQTSQQLTLNGLNQNTQLQMNLNVQCINNFMGPLCDLNCNNTNAQANQAVICYSNRTATFSACKWNAQRTQVVDCNVCTHGVYNGTCAAAVVVNNWGVAYAFRTWTIVLGCLLGIALLLILCLILAYVMVLNRSSESSYKEKEETIYTSSSTNSSNRKTNVTNNNRNNRNNVSDYGYDQNQPLVTNEEWSSTSATKRPVGILSKRNEGRSSQDHGMTHTIVDQGQQVASQNNQHTSAGSVQGYGERRQDSPSTEDSYLANGQVQQTTTTTTTTTRREHIV